MDKPVKRVVAGFLWFLAGWGIGNVMVEMLGTGSVVGPLLGLVLAALVMSDPFSLFWGRRADRHAPAAGAQPEGASAR